MEESWITLATPAGKSSQQKMLRHLGFTGVRVQIAEAAFTYLALKFSENTSAITRVRERLLATSIFPVIQLVIATYTQPLLWKMTHLNWGSC
jgi:hypothetical protein